LAEQTTQVRKYFHSIIEQNVKSDFLNFDMRRNLMLFLLALSCLEFVPAWASQTETGSLATNAEDTVWVDARPMKVYHVRPGLDYVYTPFKMSRMLTMVPSNIGKYCSVTFRRKNVLPIAAMAAGTAALIAVDQPIDDAAKHVSRHWGLKPTEHQKPIIRPSIRINGQLLKLYINVPSDVSNGIYFLGDGIVHLGTAAGFGVYGGLAHDHRALQTGAQLMEAIATTGFVVQVLKHVTGRESPAKHTVPGGKWRFFPNPADYGKSVPKYDAWPTGHLATAMATVTVIADNYPEWKLARPIGYTLMAACGFAMLNNGVHWASDYPFGISLGYTMAKLVEASGRLVVSDPTGDQESPDNSVRTTLRLEPLLLNGGLGYAFVCRF
jgi:hypothetical protein